MRYHYKRECARRIARIRTRIKRIVEIAGKSRVAAASHKLEGAIAVVQSPDNCLRITARIEFRLLSAITVGLHHSVETDIKMYSWRNIPETHPFNQHPWIVRSERCCGNFLLGIAIVNARSQRQFESVGFAVEHPEASHIDRVLDIEIKPKRAAKCLVADSIARCEIGRAHV